MNAAIGGIACCRAFKASEVSAVAFVDAAAPAADAAAADAAAAASPDFARDSAGIMPDIKNDAHSALRDFFISGFAPAWRD